MYIYLLTYGVRSMDIPCPHVLLRAIYKRMDSVGHMDIQVTTNVPSRLPHTPHVTSGSLHEYINLPGYSDGKPQRRTRRALVGSPDTSVSNSHKSVTNRSLPACKRLEARAELEPLGAKTPYQIPAQGMVCPVPLFDMATWVQRHRARGVPPSCYTERAPAAVHHKTLPRPDTEELSGPVGPLSVTRTGRCPVLDPYSR